MSFPHYTRAPIAEAVIDLRVAAAEGVNVAAIEELATSLKSEFPVQTPMFHGQFSVAISQPPAIRIPSRESAPKVRLPIRVRANQDQIGIRLASQSSSRVLQITVNGFTYSHLPPYTSWKTFRHEAIPLWSKYVEAVCPDVVSRAALRYINRLNFKGPEVEPKDFLNLYPNVPKGIPPDITGMFMQLRMPQDDIGAMAIINCALADPEDPEFVSVVLDFDVFQMRDMKPTDPKIWDALDQLDERKNLLFNECLTERSKELYI